MSNWGARSRADAGSRACDSAAARDPGDQLARVEAGGAELREREVVAALGEAAAVLVGDQRDVPPLRVGQAERLLDEPLARGGGEQVVAADDLADALARVVDDDGELVGDGAGAARDGEVADVGVDVGGEGAGELVDEVEAAGVDDQAHGRVAAARATGFFERRELAAAGAGVATLLSGWVRG